MYTQKSFNLVVTHTDEEYAARVSQLEYSNPDREGEEPIRNFIEKEYVGKNIDDIQDKIDKDFGVEFRDHTELFDWFWYPNSLLLK